MVCQHSQGLPNESNTMFKKIIGLLTKGTGGLADLADRFITTPDEKKAFEKGLKEFEARVTRELLELEVQDRMNAREMYKEDSKLQKAYAIVFLVAYISITIVMLFGIYKISSVDVEIPEYAIGFVSTLFGAMSTKVSTITDFLFGGSMKEQK